MFSRTLCWLGKHKVDVFPEPHPLKLGEIIFVFRCIRCGYIEKELSGRIKRNEKLSEGGPITVEIYDE